MTVMPYLRLGSSGIFDRYLIIKEPELMPVPFYVIVLSLYFYNHKNIMKNTEKSFKREIFMI